MVERGYPRPNALKDDKLRKEKQRWTWKSTEQREWWPAVDGRDEGAAVGKDGCGRGDEFDPRRAVLWHHAGEVRRQALARRHQWRRPEDKR